MFAQAVKHVKAGGAIATAAAIALVVGSACKHVDCGCVDFEGFTVNAWGANVIPAPSPADTSARASLSFNSATLSYTYNVTVAPQGTIDSIALYQVDAGQALPASATVILCAGATKSAATSGTGTLVSPATNTTIRNSMRGFGTQVVFFTTTAQMAAGGAMRGTMYLIP
jgi:hypothetical protein